MGNLYLNHGQLNPTSWKKWAVIMGLCFFSLAALSFFRLWYIGTPGLDDLPMQMPWEIIRRTIFFLLMSVAGIAFLKIFFQKIDDEYLNKLFWASLTIQFIAAFALPLTSNDIFSNLAFGKMSHLGLNPGLTGVAALSPDDPFRQITSGRWLNMPMVYGPVIAWLNYLMTRPENLLESVIIYKIVSFVFGIIITILALIYCKKNFRGPERCSSFALFALNPAFIWEIASQAHNDAIMIIGILAFLLFVSSENLWAALVCLVFATVTKISILPALAFYFFYTFFKSKKHFIWFSISFVVGAAVLTYTFSEKLQMILAIPSSGEVSETRLTGTPLFLIFKYLGPAYYKIYWYCAMILMSALGLFLALRTRSLDKLFLNSFLFIFLFIFIASPTYQPWYVLWVLPFAMALKDDKLRNFIAVFSVISMAQYAILNSTTGAIINILVLVIFLILRPYGSSLFKRTINIANLI